MNGINIFDKIIIKKAELLDFDSFYKIKSDYSIIYWSGFREPPKYEELKKWYEHTLSSNILRVVYFILYETEKIGSLYLDKVGDNAFEIAIAICEKYQGKGIGSITLKKFLRMIFERFNNPHIQTWIFESNIPSINMFKKNGFIATDETWEMDFPLKNTKEKQIKFIFRGKFDE
jgi:RimJ/RimL family protein N-acetyltransferase